MSTGGASLLGSVNLIHNTSLSMFSVGLKRTQTLIAKSRAWDSRCAGLG